MGRLSISVSRENRPVIVQRKWPSTPKILLLVLVPLILIGVLWFIVITVRSKKLAQNKDGSNASSNFADRLLNDEYELQFMVNHHIHHNFTRERNDKFEETFCFVQLFAPCHEILASLGSCKDKDTDSKFEWKVVEKTKTLDPKPKFMIIDAPIRLEDWSDEYYKNLTKGFVKLVSELDAPLILVPGSKTGGGKNVEEIINIYKETFGEDHFEFFVGGVKFIVTNSIYDNAESYDSSFRIEPSVFEYESWLSLSLEESRANTYQHVILLRNSLESFEVVQSKSVVTETQEEAVTRDRSHSTTQRFLDKVVNFNVENVVTYEGKSTCEKEEVAGKSEETVHKTDHHEPVGYYRGATILLSEGLNSDDYRLVWVFRDGIHGQVYDSNN